MSQAELQLEVIRSRLSLHGVACEVDLLDSVDSTNRWLVKRARETRGPHICIAREQTAGRGRRGRDWQSGSDALTFSLLRHFNLAPLRLSGLSLVAGSAIAGVLSAHGARGIGLKWPNDLLWQGRKLAGILIEIIGARESDCSTITGIGINYASAPQVDQPVAALSDAFAGTLPDRSLLLGDLLAELLQAFDRFEREGFAPFLADWAQHDLLAGREINIQAGNEWLAGRAIGVSDEGALRVEVDGREELFSSGEVSVRLAP